MNFGNLSNITALTLKYQDVFCNIKNWAGGHDPPPPANSETKEARTMKVCTLIVYYIIIITKQLKFLKFHCSIVLAIILLCA